MYVSTVIIMIIILHDRLITYYIIITYLLLLHLPGHGDIKSPGESEENVEMQRCGAYEVVHLSQQKVTMRVNPAYVDVTLA